MRILPDIQGAEMSKENDMLIGFEDPEPKLYARIPHLVDALPLSLPAYRLYCRIRHRAGEEPDGHCEESTVNLAKSFRVSKDTIVRARKELVRWGLIRVEKVKSKHGEFDKCWVTITNIWAANILACASKEKGGMNDEERKAFIKSAYESGESVNWKKAYLDCRKAGKHGVDHPKTRKAKADRPIEELVAGYPKDVRELLQEIVRLFHFAYVPERTPARGGKPAQWIKELRRINEMIDGYGFAPLRWAYEDYLKRPREISHPAALNSLLVNALREYKAVQDKKAADRAKAKAEKEREKNYIPAPDHMKPL